jgi:pyruvate dehydrogenase E2 component (dihydrolipoamide acetyltransferase)
VTGEPAGKLSGDAARTRVSPMVRGLAHRLGVDLAKVNATGPGGLILKDDVLAAHNRDSGALPPAGTPANPAIVMAGLCSPSADAPAAAAAAAPAGAPAGLDSQQLVVARRVLRSHRDIPSIQLTARLDMTAAVEARQGGLPDTDKPSFDAIFIYAVSRIIRRFEPFLAHLDQETLVRHGAVDIAFAASAGDRLYLPVVRSADTLDLPAIDAQVRQFAQKAKAGRLTPSDLAGGTFSVSNLGMYPIESFSVIIPPGQSAALAVGAAQDTVVARGGGIVVRPTALVMLCVDHRLINGRQAAEFLGELKRGVESI